MYKQRLIFYVILGGFPPFVSFVHKYSNGNKRPCLERSKVVHLGQRPNTRGDFLTWRYEPPNGPHGKELRKSSLGCLASASLLVRREGFLSEKKKKTTRSIGKTSLLHVSLRK